MYYALACTRTLSERGNKRLKLTPAFGSLGTRSLLGLFGCLGRLLWMLDGPLLVIRLHPSLIVSGPLDAGGDLGIFCAFGWLLGVLRPLFAHHASYLFPLRSAGREA